ncbi:MAG: HEPN domain-containing protein [Candidatus Helarchaeota archaeon]|nr:HEPN domain-containing protein [Candidatus Helarchaeota archaeon]
MKEDKDILGLLKKAKESIKGAEVLFKEKLYDFSVGRSYYAMFYTVQAILLTKNLSFSSHKAVIATFGKDFIKSGEIPSDLHRHLRDAFRLRQAGDYSIQPSVNKEQAQILITQGQEFLKIVEEYLNKKGYSLKPIEK